MSGSHTSSRPDAGVRVLVVFGNIPLYGHERGNIAVFSALRECGVDCLFATNAEWGSLFVTPYLDQLGLRWSGIVFPILVGSSSESLAKSSTLRRIAAANRSLARLIRDYDPTHLYVANETFFITMLPALALSRRPLVYRVGDSPQRYRGFFRLLWRHVLARRVRTFVCVSRFIAGRVQAAGVPADKLRVIYTFPSRRLEGSPADRTIPEAWPEGFTVAYAGQLTADKGIDVLVEAALRLCGRRPDVRFLIAGDFAWKNPLAQSLRERVAASPHGDRIRFLGMIESVPRLFGVSDVHACPSVWDEPLANVVLEAKASGLPSIVFPVGGLPEVVEHLVDGYICKTPSVEALEEAIGYLADNRSACRRLGENARSALEGRFGIDRFRREWLAVLS